MDNSSEDTIIYYLKQQRKYNELLKNVGCPIPQDIVSYKSKWAIINDKLKVLAYFEEECDDCIHGQQLCEIAAAYGKLNCLKYLISHGHPWDVDSFDNAAENGYLEIVQYLYGLNPEIIVESDAYEHASQNGHLNIVQYLFEQGASPNDGAAIGACKSGQLDILQYVHTNGFAIIDKAFQIAIDNNQLECIEYLVDNVDMHSLRLTSSYLLQYMNLNQFGGNAVYPLSSEFDTLRMCMTANAYYSGNNYDILKFLIKKGFPYEQWMITPFVDETWIQVIQLKKGIVNVHNLHIQMKIRRIQKAWHEYAGNPTTSVGKRNLAKLVEMQSKELQHMY